jgi:anti-sigma factor RsiW
MISCADFLAEISSFLDGEVDPGLRKHLEAHLAQCQTCTVLVDSTRKTLRIVTDSGSFDWPEGESEAVVSSIMSRIRSRGELK